MTARVVSWTRLIAAGCPSEFAIRAPSLGGLTSMILSFEEGPQACSCTRTAMKTT